MTQDNENITYRTLDKVQYYYWRETLITFGHILLRPWLQLQGGWYVIIPLIFNQGKFMSLRAILTHPVKKSLQDDR